MIVGVNEGIWQVDPTGQFWKCQVAVVGQGADKARSFLLEKIATSPTTTSEDSEATPVQLQTFFSELSIQDAVMLAGECLQHTRASSVSGGNETKTPTSYQPVIALSMQKSEGGQQEVRWYSGEDFEIALNA